MQLNPGPVPANQPSRGIPHRRHERRRPARGDQDPPGGRRRRHGLADERRRVRAPRTQFVAVERAEAVRGRGRTAGGRGWGDGGGVGGVGGGRLFRVFFAAAAAAAAVARAGRDQAQVLVPLLAVVGGVCQLAPLLLRVGVDCCRGLGRRRCDVERDVHLW